MPSLSLIDEYVVQRTSGLVAYLKELVEQSSERVRDTAADGTIWLDDYQEHLAARARANCWRSIARMIPSSPARRAGR